MKIFIDFETRSTAKLQAVGTDVYAKHPSTELICVAWAVDNGPIQVSRSEIDVPEEAYTSGLWYAHNASFERNIWRRCGYPELPVERWRCTMARASSLHLPASLEKVAQVLGIAKKDMEGRRLMLRYSQPRRARKGEDKSQTYWHEDPDDIARIMEYCRQDVHVERELHRQIGDLPEDELQVWLMDQRINERGLQVDMDFVADAIATYEQHVDQLTEELQRITRGYVATGSERDKILRWLICHGCLIADLRADTVAAAVAQEMDPELIRVLQIRQSLSKSSIKKYQAAADRVSGGRLRNCFAYHHASTGRWAGRGVQLQNLPRGSLSPSQIESAVSLMKSRDPELIELTIGPLSEVLSSSVRGILVAAPGKKLIVSDFSGVEARGIAWIAEQQNLLDMFARGVDSYREMASRIYDKPAGEISKTERHLGKTAVLGCGYGMGAVRFRSTCESQGIEISEQMAQRAVSAYRDLFPQIASFWRGLFNAFLDTVRETARPRLAKGLHLLAKDRRVMIQLPSGRMLSYYDCETCIDDLGRPQVSHMTMAEGGWHRRFIHGGLLAENVVSGICRDLLVYCMQRLEADGYTVVGHVHDEVILEVESGSVAEVEWIMSEPPEWAEGFPLSAEGFECLRYRK